jgi:dipeptidyl aminopeptidase/acylaminoacyl peptidase
MLDADSCVALGAGAVTVCRADYVADSLSIEAICCRPAGGGPFPGVILIPGFQRTARDWLGVGMRLARQGFATLAITQPGFGRSEGAPDYAGPRTLRALAQGWNAFRREVYVDSSRVALYGHSRGAMAASLLAVQLPDVRAAVLSAGVYDFQRAYDTATIEGIRRNMESETGMTESAVQERSSIHKMEALQCPVLILHGEKDENVAVEQATLLRDRLESLGKGFEIHVFPELDHSLRSPAHPGEVDSIVVDFLRRNLGPQSAR